MAIAQITRSGLITTAILVTCLWACVLAEARILRVANRNLSVSLIRLNQLRRKSPTIPASRPLPPSHLPRPVAG